MKSQRLGSKLISNRRRGIAIRAGIMFSALCFGWSRCVHCSTAFRGSLHVLILKPSRNSSTPACSRLRPSRPPSLGAAPVAALGRGRWRARGELVVGRRRASASTVSLTLKSPRPFTPLLRYSDPHSALPSQSGLHTPRSPLLSIASPHPPFSPGPSLALHAAAHASAAPRQSRFNFL